MSRRRTDMPIILSHSTRTGIMTFPNRRMGGRDVLIVGLKKEIPSGESYDMEDVDWIKSVLHFADIGALRVTVNCLTQELERWEKEGRTDEPDKQTD